MIPIGAYLTWGGRRFEGSGVQPEVEIDWSWEQAEAHRDVQYQGAIETVTRLGRP